MKNEKHQLLLVWCCFLLGISIANAQIGQIVGTVYDSKTLEPLPFANVFINNTTMGAPSDQNGVYHLKDIPTGIHEVVYSYVGYETYMTRVTVHDQEIVRLNIKLVPQEQELATVQVEGTRDKKWQKELEKFKDEFLGTSRGAKKCKIINPWVLEFEEKKVEHDNMLYATASQPIEIENLALGYKVTCILQGFAAGYHSYVILGKYRFEEIPTSDEKVAARWTQNRFEAYQGSVRHLFASFVTGNVREQGFVLYSDNPSVPNSTLRTSIFANNLGKTVIPLTMMGVVTPGNSPGEHIFNFKGRIEVHYIYGTALRPAYKDVTYQVSWLEIKEPLVLAPHGVIVNSTALLTSGAMSEARIAEMLPKDYQPFQTVKVTK